MECTEIYVNIHKEGKKMYIKIENSKKELLVYIKICYMNKKIYSFFLNHLDAPK